MLHGCRIAGAAAGMAVHACWFKNRKMLVFLKNLHGFTVVGRKAWLLPV